MNMRRPNVYIPNKAGHDFSDAERFGELVFLTQGIVKRYSTNHIYRQLIEGMSGALSQDYLLISSLSIINAIAASILARQFGKVNYLLFSGGSYMERTVDVDALLQKDTTHGTGSTPSTQDTYVQVFQGEHRPHAVSGV
jgi:hypothetical protein